MEHTIHLRVLLHGIENTKEGHDVYVDGISILNMLHKMTNKDEPNGTNCAELDMWCIARAVRWWMWLVFLKTKEYV